MMTGGELFVACLKANAIDVVTTVPGESFLPVLDALYDEQIRVIPTRHEAAAANMAEALGKLRGRPAVCLVTRGPGASHASVAVHTAFQDGTPMILGIGQVERAHRGREAFQEVDYTAVFATQSKLVIEVTDIDRIPEHVARAVNVATSGRPGPVVLSLPEDVLFDQSESVPLAAPVRRDPTASDAQLDIVTAALGAAVRPLIVVGGPKWSQEAADALTAFAEMNAVPLAAAFRYQDMVDNRSSAYVGYLGLGGSGKLREFAESSDCIVALGCRLDDPSTGSYELTWPKRSTVIVVSDDAVEATTGLVPDQAIVCTSASLAIKLRDEHLDGSAARSRVLANLRAEHERFQRSGRNDNDPLDLAEVVEHVRRRTADTAVVTNGAGNYAGWLQRFFEFRTVGTYLGPHNGAMGYGLPAALAAAVLHPDRQIIAFAGDGCFLMAGNELSTAVSEGLRVIVIVVNNGILSTIRMHQERHYPGRVIATNVPSVDFVRYAESFGVDATRVTRTDEFAAAFDAALSTDGPTLIEVMTNPAQLTADIRLESA